MHLVPVSTSLQVSFIDAFHMVGVQFVIKYSFNAQGRLDITVITTRGISLVSVLDT